MLTRLFWTTIAAGVMAAFAGAANAQDGIEAKVQLCAACHGANGAPNDPKTVPNIWGQQPYFILKQLSDYRNGMREHPIMTPIAKSLQQADLRAIAAYFAAKPWPANTTAAAGGTAPAGLTTCIPCHQMDFKGGISWPRIAGLNSDYLVASMNAFATEQRTNNGDMPRIMQMYSASDREAMAKYLAGL